MTLTLCSQVYHKLQVELSFLGHTGHGHSHGGHGHSHSGGGGHTQVHHEHNKKSFGQDNIVAMSEEGVTKPVENVKDHNGVKSDGTQMVQVSGAIANPEIRDTPYFIVCEDEKQTRMNVTTIEIGIGVFSILIILIAMIVCN